jgi:hypothetical protein
LAQIHYSDWQIFADQLLKEKKIRIYFEPKDLYNKSISIQIDSNDIVGSLKSSLKRIDLDILVYNESQWVLVRSGDLEKSFAHLLNLESLEQQRQSNLRKAVRIRNLGDPGKASTDALVKITGQVLEENTNLPVIGATIETEEKNTSMVTDATGHYTLMVPKGKNQFTIRSVGMNIQVMDVMVYSNAVLNIKLLEDAINLSEIVVKERANDENIKKIMGGVDQLALKEIKRLPAFMGETDVIKSLLTLPGVRSAGEGIGGLNVRGGNTDQNLILQDNILFFNPTHALGFFSLFQPDLVESVRLYKGNMPAKYGGRLSSVLQTISVTGDKTNWKINGGIGAVSSKIAFQGPIIKDRLTIATGGRLSTINWLLKQVQVPDVQNSKVNFYDMQGKLHYWINKNSTAGVQFYNADDKLKLANEVEFGYNTLALSAYYQTLLSRNKNLNIRLIKGKYNSVLDDLLPVNGSLFKTGVDYLAVKSDLTIHSTEKTSFNIGFEATRYKVNPGNVVPSNTFSEIKPKIIPSDHALEAGLFAEAQFPITAALTFQIGMRVSAYSMIGPMMQRLYNTENYFPSNNQVGEKFIGKNDFDNFFIGLEPRFSANYEINSSSSIKLSANRNFQYLNQISNTVAATPIDFWKLSDNNIKPQSSWAYSLGLYKNFQDNAWETSFEIYYRDIKNTVEYKDFADLLANDHIESELLLGIGKNYGAELSVKKSIGKFTNRLGYTYGRSLKQIYIKETPALSINQGTWYASNFDKPHELNILINYNASQRYSFNLNYNYSSGRPITAPNGKFDDWNIFGAPIYSNRNNFRLPDYQRLDISFNIFPGYRKDRRLKGSWTLGVYNALANKNAYSVNFRGQSISKLRAYKLSVLGTVFPFITYNFQIQ